MKYKDPPLPLALGFLFVWLLSALGSLAIPAAIIVIALKLTGVI